ncbi:hypothetical protein Agabi119p4_8397 [Agaricus bisporus var. burnettii]|uniref:Kinesin-like protein n=1 Tax=Agaricus bisporus var. burnettii TaxID=192524 RepID=A0A8H7EYG3_AGABI|nr:hypothetical protein Agabi119p4_8397 [Agaricus bisporus var. burnettii]
MAHSIKIAARLRPALPGEITDDNISIQLASNESTDSAMKSSHISVLNPRDITQIFKFPFPSCYDHNSTQKEIFRNDVEPLLDVVYKGVTVTIFAYGVTSSGKTHTMQGTKSDPGIIPRTVQALFGKRIQYPQYKISFTMSYMELYKDEPYDLLVTRENAPKLPVREDGNGMVFVANLSSVPIASALDFDQIYYQATKNRSIGATLLNRASSRSHAVLTIEVVMLDPLQQKTVTGKINLVDLAGSENNKLTGNDPSRMAESRAINQSLSVLGQVVHALNQGASRIPYRNSKLTRLLQDALGGSSMGLLICNLAPGTKFRQDTLNTLNFATRTKNVENKPVINERDNRLTAKPHFAAPPAPKPAPTVLQTIHTGASAASSSAGAAIATRRARASLGPSVPRMQRPRGSSIGLNNNVAGFQRFALTGGRRLTETIDERSSMADFGMRGMTEKDIEDKITRVVEAEVAKRLAVERQKDEEERKVKEAKEKEEAEKRELERRKEEDVQGTPTKKGMQLPIPSGLLTPLLKKHRDLDDELRARLHDLEKKLEQGQKETSLASSLSPISKKKTGRAYVALARAHSEKGKLAEALELYRRAEAYVPDNIKLKERIIEIEWAVQNNKEFVPSPKPPRRERKKKNKGRGGGRGRKSNGVNPETRSSMAGVGVGCSKEEEEDGGDGETKKNGKGIGGDGPENGLKPSASRGRHHGHGQHKLGTIVETTEFGQEITNAANRGNSMPGSFMKVNKRPFGDVEEGDRDLKDGSSRRDGLRAPMKKVKLEEESDNGGMASEDEVEGHIRGEIASAQRGKALNKAA